MQTEFHKVLEDLKRVPACNLFETFSNERTINIHIILLDSPHRNEERRSHLSYHAHLVSYDALSEFKLLDGQQQCTQVGLLIERLLGRWYVEGEVQPFLQQSIVAGLSVDHPGQVSNKDSAEVIDTIRWIITLLRYDF